MTHSEARELVEGLKARFDGAFSPKDKETIKRLYLAVFGKAFRVTSCQRCYHDAVIELYLYLKNNMELAKPKNYELKRGFIIACPTFHNGQIFTNDNLTDEIAEEYLQLFPNMAKYYARIPEKPVLNAPQTAETEKVNNYTPAEKKPRRTKKAKK